MLLFIAFMCFAVLLASWLVMPEQRETTAPKPVEHVSPDVGAATAPARA